MHAPFHQVAGLERQRKATASQASVLTAPPSAQRSWTDQPPCGGPCYLNSFSSSYAVDGATLRVSGVIVYLLIFLNITIQKSLSAQLSDSLTNCRVTSDSATCCSSEPNRGAEVLLSYRHVKYVFTELQEGKPTEQMGGGGLVGGGTALTGRKKQQKKTTITSPVFDAATELSKTGRGARCFTSWCYFKGWAQSPPQTGWKFSGGTFAWALLLLGNRKEHVTYRQSVRTEKLLVQISFSGVDFYTEGCRLRPESESEKSYIC